METQAAVAQESAKFKRVRIIMNPVSGLNPRSPEAIQALLDQIAHIEWDLKLTEKDGDAYRFAQEAVEAGYDAVGAYGGDGTVMEVATGLRGTKVPLAIFPAGTANVMSKELNIASDFEAALSLVCSDQCFVRSVDMGQVGDHYFLLRIGIGLEAEMTLGAEREEKKKLGRIAYFKAAWRAIRQTRQNRYRIKLDGKKVRSTRGVTCMICNSGNVGIPNLKLAPEINVSDGLLDVVVVGGLGIRSIIPVLISTFKSLFPGTRRDPHLKHWKAREITINARRKQMISLDGEPLKEKFPLMVKVLPGALRVVVPGGGGA